LASILKEKLTFVAQTVLSSGQALVGNIPVSGFNCYSFTAAKDDAITINVTLDEGSAPLEVLGT
jgi:hypothetical protein